VEIASGKAKWLRKAASGETACLRRQTVDASLHLLDA